MRQNVRNDNWSDSISIVPTIDSAIDATANDSDKSWTVPGNEMWKIVYSHIVFISSATVGNRQILFAINDDSGNLMMDIAAGAVQAASLTRHYGFVQGVYRETAFVSNEIQVPIPIDCYLKPGWTLRIYDSAAIAAAADDMTVTITYEKYII